MQMTENIHPRPVLIYGRVEGLPVFLASLLPASLPLALNRTLNSSSRESNFGHAPGNPFYRKEDTWQQRQRRHLNQQFPVSFHENTRCSSTASGWIPLPERCSPPTIRRRAKFLPRWRKATARTSIAPSKLRAPHLKPAPGRA